MHPAGRTHSPLLFQPASPITIRQPEARRNSDNGNVDDGMFHLESTLISFPPRNVSIFSLYCITCSKRRATTYSMMITFFLLSLCSFVSFFFHPIRAPSITFSRKRAGHFSDCRTTIARDGMNKFIWNGRERVKRHNARHTLSCREKDFTVPASSAESTVH